MHFLDYVCMIFFLVIIIGIGTYFAKRATSTSSFLLGSGKMPWWAVGISYLMALLSTVSLVATPGEAYNHGLRFYIMDWIGPISGLITFHLFIHFYFKVKTFTPFAYLESRFSPAVRAMVSTSFLCFRVTYLSMVLFSCAMVFKGLADWNVPRTIALIGIVAFLYSTLGGLRAVIWVNVLKFFILVGSLLLTVGVCIREVDGGIPGVIKFAFANNHGFNFNSIDSNFFSFDPHVRITLWFMIISSLSGYMFSNSADQIAIQQLLSTSSYKQARRSFFTSLGIALPFGFILWFLGLSMFAYFSQHPLPGGNPGGDVALFKFIRMKMPAPMPGLVASAMLATAISTSGAAMNALATVATKDFYFRFFRPTALETDQVKFSRYATVVVGILAILISILISIISRSLGETVLEAASMWVAIMCVIAPTFLVGVLSRRSAAVHITTAIICGWIATGFMIAWYYTSKKNGHPISFMFIQIPGMLTTTILGLLLPYIFGKPAPESKTAGLTLWAIRQTEPTESEKHVEELAK